MRFSQRLRVKPGEKVRLSRIDPGDTAGCPSKKKAEAALEKNIRKLTDLQYLLYAENRRALLIVLQAMDAGGKDGTIRRVLGPLNPQGCRVTSFKVPTVEELAHDYLWRIHQAAPRRGEIGAFNRSHYEDVLIVRVKKLAPPGVWAKRYDQINAFEKILVENDVHIVKFYLHISRSEQLQRLRKRIDDPRKQWKINPEDFQERRRWNAYIRAYEEALSRCSTPHAPWYVVPADHKWFRNLAVSQILVETLEKLGMKFPQPVFDVSKIKVQ